MAWFRWYNGTVDDGKMRAVARNASVTLRDVIAVWALVLEDAANPEHRGVCVKNEDYIAAVLDFEDGVVEEILNAMQGQEMISVGIGAITVTNWKKRQYETDAKDATNADRQRRFRERKKTEREANSGGTKRNGSVTAAKRPDTDTETVHKDDKSSLSSSGEPNIDPAPPERSKDAAAVREVFDYWRVRCGHERATLTQDRKAKIRARLKRYSPADLKRAIDHAAQNPFYQGDNDRQTRYDYPETLFKTDAAAERLMQAGTNGNGKPKPVIVDD
jgi:uncharacterized phage protein (TIGR02220 family)